MKILLMTCLLYITATTRVVAENNSGRPGLLFGFSWTDTSSLEVDKDYVNIFLALLFLAILATIVAVVIVVIIAMNLMYKDRQNDRQAQTLSTNTAPINDARYGPTGVDNDSVSLKLN